MKLALARTVLALAAASPLGAPVAAQVDCLPQGVTVTVSPDPAPQGALVEVTIDNQSDQLFVLPSSCLYASVREEDCDGALVQVPLCLAVLVPIPPGGSHTNVWAQTDTTGNLVAPGVYAFDLALPVDCCPTVTVTGGCAGPPQPYGDGGAGTGGFAPILDAEGGLPLIGNAAFGERILFGVGGAPAALLLGAGETSLGFDWGTLLVDPFLPVFVFPAVLGGTPGQSGAGSALIPLPIPNDPGLVGIQVATQAIVLDAGSSGGFSHTQGVRFTICQ